MQWEDTAVPGWQQTLPRTSDIPIVSCARHFPQLRCMWVWACSPSVETPAGLSLLQAIKLLGWATVTRLI